MRPLPYVRIYFERSNGRVVLDTGPNTQRMEAADVNVDVPTTGEHSKIPGDRPRFWMVARNCIIKKLMDTAYVLPIGDKP